MIGDEFHSAAVAERSEIGTLFGEVSEQALTFRNGFAVSTGVDHQISHFRLCPGSAERTIQCDMPCWLENLFKSKFISEAERTEFGHNPGRLRGICDLVSDIFDNRRSRKTGHDDRCFACELGDVVRDCHIRLHKLGASRRVDIKPDHTPTAIDQVARDGTSHDPEPDNPHGLVHSGALPRRGF
jgi:hypothetical protein